MLSIETLKWLSNKQELLDNNINSVKKILINKEIINKKIIALFVEMGEFINEERSFKFWSNKKSSEKSVLLEEYVDCIHFTVSLMNNFKFNIEDYYFFIHDEKSITNIYIETIGCFSNFIKNNNFEEFFSFFNWFLNIGYYLKFSEDDIVDAYELKNNENFERQKQNY